MALGSYEMKEEDINRPYYVWIPVPLEINSVDKVHETLADFQRYGVIHRVLQYRKDCLIVEKKVEFIN